MTRWEKEQADGIERLRDTCHKMKWGLPGDDIFDAVVEGVSEIERLHRKITDKIHLTQIADSGMSTSDCLEWIRKELSEESLQVPTH